VVWERHCNGNFEVSVLHVSLCVESGDVVCKQRYIETKELHLPSSSVMQSKQANKQTDGIQNGGCNTKSYAYCQKREETLGISGSRLQGWMNIKLSCEKLACFGFFPPNQSIPVLGKFRIFRY
jgi:hypothetical protein